MARNIIAPRKPRKLTKPLKSTLRSVRESFRHSKKPPPEEVIYEMALSQDQYIENWKAGLILVIDDPPRKKRTAPSKRSGAMDRLKR